MLNRGSTHCIGIIAYAQAAFSRCQEIKHAFLIAALALLSFSGCNEASQAVSPPPSTITIGSHGAGAGQFIQPRAIAASPKGKVFVIDKTGRVQRFTASGLFEYSWEMPDNASGTGQPSGICVDQAGRVFVADTHQSRVIVFNQDGLELFRFGERGMGPGQFMLPTDVAIDQDGFIYVSEYGGNDRISKFDPAGKYLFSFGDLMAGSGALQRPSGLAIDNENNLWVADTCNHRICRFDSHGKLLKSFGELGTASGQLRYPRDVVVLADGNLAVVDHANNRLAYFDPRGKFLSCWGNAGRGEGELNRPVNVAAIAQGALIADTMNHRITYHQFQLPPNTALKRELNETSESFVFGRGDITNDWK